MWKCVLKGNEIKVMADDKHKGCYVLLDEPYCHICSYPGVTSEGCTWHHDDYGFERIYAVGKYMSPKTPEGYNDPLSKHIRGLKKYRSYAIPLGLAMVLCMRHKYPELLKVQVVVPVPKHRSEVQKRGYNQATELSNVIREKIGIQVVEALEKTREESMRLLPDRKSRKERVKGLYLCSESRSIKDKRVLLIDDVSTSGSTASECSQVLLDSGASNVTVLVAGRDVTIDTAV